MMGQNVPQFTSTTEKIKKADTENMYKYLPDNNPWTWEQHNWTRETADTSDLLKQSSTQADNTTITTTTRAIQPME